MKERKYIDRLYQEKFRDFEATPRDAVWKSIEVKLREKKKKKAAVPLWYRYAGVAAVLAFLLMLGDWILPVQPSAAVAGDDTEEAITKPASSPVLPSEVFKPSGETTAIAEGTSPLPEKESIPAIPLSTPNKEQRTVQQEGAPGIGSKNIIFETPVPVAEVPLQKEETKPIPEEVKPSIFDALKTSEETEVAIHVPKTKIEVSTHASPIYYGNMGSANPLDVGFDDKREAQVTYSYGVSVALHLNDKVRIRSGISRVDLGYSTSGLGYRSVTGVYPVKNVSLVEIKDPEVRMVTGNYIGRIPSATNRTPAAIFTHGSLNQKMGYIEVPVEFEVDLWQKKVELNLIGGGSTFFLEENEVILNTGGTSAAGKAENLNEVSFSANLGLGLNYDLSEKFKLNLEPMLKYQLKTFDSPTGDVQPYFFGVYSGFSYKF